MLKQRGMSIVELMVAMVIGLVISAALGGVFVTTTKAKRELTLLGEQIENGRIAQEMLSMDLGQAGYWGGLEYTEIADPTLPDMCATAAADLKSALPVYMQGIDQVQNSTIPTCLADADVALNTDIVMVRRASTCLDGAANCDSVAPYFQASECYPPAYREDPVTKVVTQGSVADGAELASRQTDSWFAVGDTAASLTLHRRDCGNLSLPDQPNLADVRRYVSRIYFVANHDRAGDGMPTLKMAELRGTTWTVSTIAAGVEQLQLEYGQDTANDTSPESFVVAPTTVAAWRQIVSVKLHILSRNKTASSDYDGSSKTYLLAGTTYGPYTDHVRRHALSGLVRLGNPIGLRGG